MSRIKPFSMYVIKLFSEIIFETKTAINERIYSFLLLLQRKSLVNADMSLKVTHSLLHSYVNIFVKKRIYEKPHILLNDRHTYLRSRETKEKKRFVSRIL